MKKLGIDIRSVKDTDPLVTKLTTPSATTYKEVGFKNYHFGSTRPEIEKLVGTLPKGTSWVYSTKTGEAFLFAEDKLVGFSKTYGGDNKTYLDAALETLGKTTKDNIYSTSSRFVDTWDSSPAFDPGSVPVRRKTTTSRTIEACYFFPRTVGYLKVHEAAWATVPMLAASDRPGREEAVTVTLAERDFLLQLLDRQARVARATVKWLKTACETEDLEKLPKFPHAEATAVSSRRGTVSATKTVCYDAKSPGSTALLDAEVCTGDTRDLPTGTRIFRLYAGISRHPIPEIQQEALLLNSSINALYSQLLAHIAKEIFPPSDAGITFLTDRTPKRPATHTAVNDWEVISHEWRTKDGWAVSVSDTIITVIKRPKKTLD